MLALRFIWLQYDKDTSSDFKHIVVSNDEHFTRVAIRRASEIMKIISEYLIGSNHFNYKPHDLWAMSQNGLV